MSCSVIYCNFLEEKWDSYLLKMTPLLVYNLWIMFADLLGTGLLTSYGILNCNYLQALEHMLFVCVCDLHLSEDLTAPFSCDYSQKSPWITRTESFSSVSCLEIKIPGKKKNTKEKRKKVYAAQSPVPYRNRTVKYWCFQDTFPAFSSLGFLGDFHRQSWCLVLDCIYLALHGK